MHRNTHGMEGRVAAGSRSVPVLLILASAFVLLAAMAVAPAPAGASPLDYQGLAFQDMGGTPAPGTPLLMSSASSSDRPIRRRRPYYRERYRDYDRHEPRYYAALGAGNFDPEEQPGNGLLLNAELGGEIAEPIDLGVRLAWYHRNVGGDEIVTNFEDEAGNVGQIVIETSDVETNLVPLMALLRVRFPLSPQVQPYVGGGVGWEWLSVEGTDVDGFAFQDDYDGFGAQAFAGLNLGVSPNVAVYGEGLWNMSTVSDEFFDTGLGGNVRSEIDMDGFGIHGGLRFRF